MPDKELLERIPLLSEIFQEQLPEISGWSSILNFNENETVFKEGDKASDLYCVLDGAVELSITMMDKIHTREIRYEDSIRTRIETIEKEIVIETIEPGDIVAWSALIEPRLLTVTAKCSEPSRLISLPAEKLRSIFDKNPRAGYVFMERLAEIISQRLTHRTTRLIEGWSEAFGINRV